MLGAIIGDIVGSRYEHSRDNMLSKEFPLFDSNCRFSEHTVMTLATAEACIAGFSFGDEKMPEDVKFVSDVFKKWFNSDDIISSFVIPDATGASMSLSPVAWFSATLQDAQDKAKFISEITGHNTEVAKGAQAIASATFMAIERERGNYMSAKRRSSKENIKNYIETVYGYNLSIPLSDADKVYRHLESCTSQADMTVSAAMLAFLNGTDFEDVVRTAISLGGDSDTIAAMAGSIAEAYFGVPDNIQNQICDYMLPDLYEKLLAFEREKIRFNAGKYLMARNVAMEVCRFSKGFNKSVYGTSAWHATLDCDTPDAERIFWSDLVYWINYFFHCYSIDKRAELNERFDYFSCLEVFPIIR